MLDIPQSPASPGDYPLEQLVTFRLSRVQARLNVQSSTILQRHCGLTQIQWRAIATIAQLGETTSVAVVRVSHLDKGLLSRNLKVLIKKNLVSSRSDPNDQRSQLLSLTETGHEIHTRMVPIMEARQNHLVANLGETQRKALFSALEIIEKAAERQDFEP